MYSNRRQKSEIRNQKSEDRGHMADTGKIIYVDNSATTKVRPEVVEKMLPILQADFGNPSSIHSFGRKAKLYLDEARANIAEVINASEEQIFFTSGGTESDNTVIQGVAKYLSSGGFPAGGGSAFGGETHLNKEKHIISTKIEHSAIKEPLEYLENNGWEITWLNTDKEGFIDIEELRSKITSRTLLVSIIHANNEIGTIQDLKKISNICTEHNVLFHTDAIQSYGKIPINVKDLNIDFLSISSHKIYGPKGVGALYIKDKNKISSLFYGGGQESQIRPGTENLPGIVGFGMAAKLIKDEMADNAKKLRAYQIKLMEGLSTIEGIILTGPKKYLYRIPGHVSICCKDIEGESLVLQADLKGIACSSGSACSTRDGVNPVSTTIFKPSHVLVAINTPHEYIKGSLRLTLGKDNTDEDVEYIIESMKNIVQARPKMRSFS